MSSATALASRFKELFGGTPRVFRAPGRVNLIGEHTDYNDGFVMPAAIQFSARVAIRRIDGRLVTVRSENAANTSEFDLDDPAPSARHDWSDYVRGVAIMLERAGKALPGAQMLIHGDVPLGAGLSSSAALEVAVALAFSGVAGHRMTATEIALLCQRAENEFVGARCGIMDQFTSTHGRWDHAILLDCRSLEARYLPLPPHVRIAVSNTMVKHSLASNEYNRRRAECENAVRVLSRVLPGVHALRDVTEEDLARFAAELDPVTLRRARHVVTENRRVTDAAKALERSDLREFGRLMACSHRSLRDDYEVSCPELDAMVESASAAEGVYGTRMTGGGFGGCTVSLVEAAALDAFTATVREQYARRTGIQCEVYTCSAAEGAAEEPL